MASAPTTISPTTNTIFMSNFSDDNDTLEIEAQEPKFVFIILYTAAIVLSMVGNTLVIIVFSCGKRSRTDLRGFLISLAISDLIMALFCLPFSFSSALLRKWVFPWFMCPIVVFMQATSVTASVCTNMAIGIDRFWVVTFPLRSRLKKSRYKVMISTIWVISISLSSVLLYIAAVRENHGRYQCSENWPSQEWSRAYTIFIFILTYFLPLSMLTFTYSFVGKKLWQRTSPGNADEARDTQQLRSKRKVIKMLVVVVLLFGLCWLPLHLFQIVIEFVAIDPEYRTSHRQMFNVLYFTFHWLAMSNSFVNPIIYGFMNDSFRSDLQHLWFRVCPCCRCLWRGRRLGFSTSHSERMFSHYTVDNERRSSSNSGLYRFDSSRGSSRRYQTTRVPNGGIDGHHYHHHLHLHHNQSISNVKRTTWNTDNISDHRTSKSHQQKSPRNNRGSQNHTNFV